MSEKLLLLAAFVISMLLMAGNHKRKRKRIVFFGDSLTNFGSRPGGYIRRIERILKEKELEDKYELLGEGVNGNTVLHLHRRADRDVLSEGADVVVIFIGINDIWHQQMGKGVFEKEFEAIYEELIQKFIAAEIKIVLCTLTVIGERLAYQNEQDAEIEIYNNIIKKLASKFGLPVADLRAAFLAYNLLNNINNQKSGILTYDGVHLNDTGNQLAAEELWKVLQQVTQQ